MLSDLFWNILVPIAIVGVPLFYVASWVWLLYKADRLVHRAFEKPPYVPTPEEKAESLARSLKMFAEIEQARQANAHHH